MFKFVYAHIGSNYYLEWACLLSLKGSHFSSSSNILHINITRKMVPITGRASASFSSMLKLKRIGNGVTFLTAKKKTLSMRVGRT